MGMSALAVMLKESGYSVSGSDEGFYEPAFGYLKKHGIPILTPHKAKNIPKDADLIVIGKHAKLDSEKNEEVKEALKYKEKIKSFPVILGEIIKDRENIVVAGSYGKSTCTALLAWCMRESEIDIGYFFGAMSLDMEKSAEMGSSKYFLLEGDEYPAWNGESKFLYLHPRHLLLTSAEHDHVNVFPTEKSYLEPYQKLIEMIPRNGSITAAIENPNVKDLVAKSKTEVTTYGFGKDSLWRAENIRYGKETMFELWKEDRKITELSTTLFGKHNIENIVGASAFLLEKEIITKEQLKKAIRKFKGLKRRLDLKTNKSSVLVYEGFGSSYTKAKTVFDALKLHFPDKRIITVFEPHTFSWRNKNNLKWYRDIFKDSDETIIFKPPEHGKDSHEQIKLEEITGEVKKTKKNVYGVERKEEALKILEKITKPKDIIILMSSGDLGGLIEEVPKFVEKIYPR